MSQSKPERGKFTDIRDIKRKTVRLSEETLVKIGYPDSGSALPMIIEANIENMNLNSWAKTNHEYIERELLKHGALLFRNFRVKSPEAFEEFIETTSGQLIKYNERSSPRSQVSGNIYTSTDYPPDQGIFLHNEQSYNMSFPLRIFFACFTAASQGGQTPIADSRKVLNRISPAVRERFIQKGYMYVRNFGDGFGLSWRTAFQTTDRAVVEDYCRRNEIEFEWRSGDRLRTRQVRRVVAQHPKTGELTWFNHLTFFHVSTLDETVRELLRANFEEEDLPNNTYYGDSSPIEPEVLEETREAYLREKVIFCWQEGDILMLDNLLTSHGREPFVGPRKVLVGMAQPFSLP